MLGKRHRGSDSDQVDVTDVGPEGHPIQEEQGRRVGRPSKKRLKLSKQDEARSETSSSAQQSDQVVEAGSGEGRIVPRGVAFTIFQGPEEPPESVEHPPTQISDLFPFGSIEGQITPPNGMGGAIPRPPGADENAPNNFNSNIDFSTFEASLFQAVTSTPFNMNLPPFTYPEPPTSPSPAAPSGGFIERAGGRIERNDLFQPLRRFTPATAQAHTPSRPQSAIGRRISGSEAGPSQLQPPPSDVMTIDPSALMRTPTLPAVPEETSASASSSATANLLANGFSRRTVSSTEVGMQLGMSSTSQLPPDTPGAPIKRTMYGTELDGDTRFGDFGVEGVASGFWAGLARRL